MPCTKTIVTKVKIGVTVTMATETGSNKAIFVMWAKSDKINFSMWSKYAPSAILLQKSGVMFLSWKKLCIIQNYVFQEHEACISEFQLSCKTKFSFPIKDL